MNLYKQSFSSKFYIEWFTRKKIIAVLCGSLVVIISGNIFHQNSIFFMLITKKTWFWDGVEIAKRKWVCLISLKSAVLNESVLINPCKISLLKHTIKLQQWSAYKVFNKIFSLNAQSNFNIENKYKEFKKALSSNNLQ